MEQPDSAASSACCDSATSSHAPAQPHPHATRAEKGKGRGRGQRVQPNNAKTQKKGWSGRGSNPNTKVGYVSSNSTSSSSSSPSTASKQKDVKKEEVEVEVEVEGGALLFIDSHVHLDMAMEKFGWDLHSAGGFVSFVKEHFNPTTIHQLYAAKSTEKKKGSKPGPSTSGSEVTRVPNFHFGSLIHVCCFPHEIPPTKILMDTQAPETKDIFVTMGMHPHSASSYNEAMEATIVEAMKHPKVVAWGEMGLDFYRNLSARDEQIVAFRRQIKKAVELDKPMVIHSREADEDTLVIMRELIPRDWRVHMHCFGSGVEVAKELLEGWTNLYIGFTGAITFPSAQQQAEVIKIVPMDRLLLETDSPFMAPVPHRGKTCHSGMLPLVAKKVAEIKAISIQEVVQQTAANARIMYGLPTPVKTSA